MITKTAFSMPPPRTQALSSKTFRPPPLDGTLTLPELYDWHLSNTPDHPLFLYSDSEGCQHTILWPATVRAIHRVGRIIQRRLREGIHIQRSKPKVVAILAGTDTITYFTVLIGVIRAGHTVFPISPRNSPAATAHLLRKANVAHVLVGAEHAFQSLVAASVALLKQDSDEDVPETSIMFSFDDIYITHDDKFEPLPFWKPDLDTAAFILHSSGSTAFPKPVTWTHRHMMLQSLTPYFGERDMCGVRLACHSMPMFHGMGVMQTGWTSTTGVIVTTFEPQSPAISPTPDTVIKCAMASRCDVIICVPSFIEAWARSSVHLAYLQRTQGVLYGGGPLSKEVGDSLTRNGVKVFVLYGSTECGHMSSILPLEVNEDWDYFRLSGSVKTEFVSDGAGKAELFILPNEYHVPCVLNAKVSGVDAYATNDLFTPHPTKPGYWKIYGRVDDQIMHSTGEKTNPGPLENILNQDPHILSSVIFGRGRFNAGVIIDPKPEFRFDPSDLIALDTFRQEIWPTVERMNHYAPQHSRVFKEMILVSSPQKPFTYTAKNTPRRQAIIADFDSEIEVLYAAVQETTQSDIPLPTHWSLPLASEFVRTVVKKVMKTTISDDDDVFQCGCDSLQATWIRNSLLNALRVSAKVNTRLVPYNFVYQHPSIKSLSAYAVKLAARTTSVSNGENGQLSVQRMTDLVAKYSDRFPRHVPASAPLSTDIILITGTTGGLGSVLLAKALESPNVGLVYALNRKGASLLERQKIALEERGYSSSILGSPKLSLLEGNLCEANLGLDKDTFEMIRTSVTHIIHNAYPVDFNMALSSFEPSVAGLRSLIDVALSSPLPSPPFLLFMSSISVLNQHPSTGPVAEEPVEPTSAVGHGYSESKWVCEQLLTLASARTPLKSASIRIGQMSGVSTMGCWNTKEWVPTMVKSSIHLGCFPDIDQDISWIPMDVAAEGILEMRNAPFQTLHVVHPNSVSWTSIFRPLSEDLGIPLVPYHEWLAKLDEDGTLSAGQEVELAKKNPALRLTSFFHAAAEMGTNPVSREAMGLKRLSIDKALKVSPALRDEQLNPLTAESARKWLAYWKATGYLA